MSAYPRPQQDALVAEVQRLFGAMWQSPRYQYWEHNGYHYGWTTERAKTTNGEEGFIAFIYRPIGKGSRTKKATTRRLAKQVRFAKRHKAKTRAFRWYLKSRNAQHYCEKCFTIFTTPEAKTQHLQWNPRHKSPEPQTP